MQEMREIKELYQKDNGEWALCPYIIKYTHGNEQVEQLTDDIAWFERFAETWADFEMNEVVEIPYTQEQLDRLNDVQGIEFKHYDEVYNYVINGKVNVDSKVFTIKNVVKLASQVTESELALIEIYETVLGV